MGKRSYLEEPISFSEEYLDKIIKPHEENLVIKANIGEDCRVSKIMVDNGSTMDILYYNAFQKNGLQKRATSASKGTILWFYQHSSPNSKYN